MKNILISLIPLLRNDQYWHSDVYPSSNFSITHINCLAERFSNLVWYTDFFKSVVHCMPLNSLCNLRSEVSGKRVFTDLTPNPGRPSSGTNAPMSRLHHIWASSVLSGECGQGLLLVGKTRTHTLFTLHCRNCPAHQINQASSLLLCGLKRGPRFKQLMSHK